MQALFLEGSRLYSAWRDETDRYWQHWTQRYINYFGPRTEAVGNPYFPTANDSPQAADQPSEVRKLAS